MKTYYNLSKNILVLTFCLFSFVVYGQYTTVIPAADKAAKIDIRGTTINFYFDLSSIPSTATIQSCKLQLTIGNDVIGKLTLDSKIANSRFGYMFLDKSFTANSVFYMNGLAEQIQRPINSNTPSIQLGLLVRSEKNTSKVSILAKDNQSPRLIITYSMPPEQPVDWSMSHANGQHSGSTFMRFGGSSPTGFTAKQISAFGDVQTDLVMYKNKIYIIDNASSKTTLYALDPITKSRTLIADRLLAPVTMPIIDRYGRLYYFSANKVEVIELENGNTKREVISFPNKNLTTSPTMGPDGSLYLVFNNDITAYTPYPIREVWNRGFTGTKSPVTMNKEGTTAYFASYTSNKVFALNTINGNTIHEAPVVLISPPTTEGPTIPLVSDDGSVIITNKLINGNKIYSFNRQLVQQKLVEGSKISQPVSGKGNNVYFVKDGSLYNYTTDQQVPFIGSVAVRSLAADQSDNVYCLGKDNKIYVYNGVSKSVVQSPASSSAFQRALVIGKDGSAYTATSSTIFGFRVNSSSSFANYTLSSNDDQRNNTTFRGKSLVVPANFSLSKGKILVGVNGVQFQDNAKILNNSDIIIESGNSISFKKGFRVAKGATLSCKLGY